MLFRSLADFDFAPNIAPTFDQLFPHISQIIVLVASGGDEPLIDPNVDWIMDSRCTSHMCNNKGLFIDFKSMHTKITAEGTLTDVVGIGIVKICAELEKEITNFTLLNTLFDSSLLLNLISQSKLEVKCL